MDQEKGFVHNRTIYGKKKIYLSINVLMNQVIQDGCGTALSAAIQNFLLQFQLMVLHEFGRPILVML
jgi:hypothetical protein